MRRFLEGRPAIPSFDTPPEALEQLRNAADALGFETNILLDMYEDPQRLLLTSVDGFAALNVQREYEHPPYIHLQQEIDDQKLYDARVALAVSGNPAERVVVSYCYDPTTHIAVLREHDMLLVAQEVPDSELALRVERELQVVAPEDVVGKAAIALYDLVNERPPYNNATFYVRTWNGG
ncbi:MAG TPA: hypothetical protein VJP80_04270 [Candidatus Saccharimonadales bacterium]|nr:hypothetical protein [Candidatus Saccharimonadales bacterium]